MRPFIYTSCARSSNTLLPSLWLLPMVCLQTLLKILSCEMWFTEKRFSTSAKLLHLRALHTRAPVRLTIPGLTKPLMNLETRTTVESASEAARAFVASATLVKAVPFLCSLPTACAMHPKSEWGDGMALDDAVCVMWRTESSNLAAVMRV